MERLRTQSCSLLTFWQQRRCSQTPAREQFVRSSNSTRITPDAVCCAGCQVLWFSMTGAFRWPMSPTRVLGAGGLRLHAQKPAWKSPEGRQRRGHPQIKQGGPTTASAPFEWASACGAPLRLAVGGGGHIDPAPARVGAGLLYCSLPNFGRSEQEHECNEQLYISGV